MECIRGQLESSHKELLWAVAYTARVGFRLFSKLTWRRPK